MLTDSALCLQVPRNKAFLGNVQAVFRAAPTLYWDGRRKQGPGEEASKAEATGSLPDASPSLKERSPCVARLHGIPLAGESPPHTEALPVPQMAGCQRSDTHRNWSVFFKLMDIRTWRSMGGFQNELQGFLVSSPARWLINVLFQKTHVAH